MSKLNLKRSSENEVILLYAERTPCLSCSSAPCRLHLGLEFGGPRSTPNLSARMAQRQQRNPSQAWIFPSWVSPSRPSGRLPIGACTEPRMGPNAPCGLWVIMARPWGLMNCSACTILVGLVHNRGGCACVGAGGV